MQPGPPCTQAESTLGLLMRHFASEAIRKTKKTRIGAISDLPPVQSLTNKLILLNSWKLRLLRNFL